MISMPVTRRNRSAMSGGSGAEPEMASRNAPVTAAARPGSFSSRA